MRAASLGSFIIIVARQLSRLGLKIKVEGGRRKRKEGERTRERQRQSAPRSGVISKPYERTGRESSVSTQT